MFADVLAELAALIREQSWMQDGLCGQVDPDAWYPGKGESTRIPKSVCAQCPVRAECLEYALENEEHHGVWGGASERERRRMRRASLAA